MKVYADLDIAGTPQQLAAALEAIEQQARARGWHRSAEYEGEVRVNGGRCFLAPATRSHPSAALWLAERSDRHWYVPNIAPVEAGRLSEDEYNSVLLEFFTAFVAPVASKMGVEATLGKFDKAARDWMSAVALERLSTFSDLANKSTGSGHPSDRERWFHFITQVCEDGHGPDGETLSALLEHEFGWPAAMASDLAVEYDFGRALLLHPRRR